MLLSHSAWRRLVTTIGLVVALLLVYQATMLDSKHATRQLFGTEDTIEPTPGAHLQFRATAYCKGSVTAAGVPPRSGIAAADPDVLPVGSVIQVESLDQKYRGIYTVMDTGPAVVGRHIDIYMWSCTEALEFGRRPVRVLVLRLGWNPKATMPRLMETLLPWRQTTRPIGPPPPLPSRPILPPDRATGPVARVP